MINTVSLELTHTKSVIKDSIKFIDDMPRLSYSALATIIALKTDFLRNKSQSNIAQCSLKKCGV